MWVVAVSSGAVAITTVAFSERKTPITTVAFSERKTLSRAPLPTSHHERSEPRARAKPNPEPTRFSPWAQVRRRATFARVKGATAFTRLAEPQPGDWLWSFREHGQTLEEYAAALTNKAQALFKPAFKLL